MTTFIVTNIVVMTNLVGFAQALGDETRWRIVRLVLETPLCVCELADILDMPQSSVSSHVQVIKKAGLLESERCEKWIYYRVGSAYRKLMLTLENFFEASPAADKVLTADAAAARKRLSQRENSCCPRPKELVSPRVRARAVKTNGKSKPV